jgi:hypothetical protein
MAERRSKDKHARKKPAALKKRRLGLSKLGFVEVVPREVADAEIEKLFEDSKVFPDGEE